MSDAHGIDDERPMPPTDENTCRTYHGLGDGYPVNRYGFIEAQAEHARWVVYRGISEGSEWHLTDGTLLELWPDGYIFNEYGTVVGRLERTWRGGKRPQVGGEQDSEAGQ